MKKELALQRLSSRKSKFHDPVSDYEVTDSRTDIPTGGSASLEKNKVEFKHLKCNKTFKMAFYNFLTGQGCPYCFGNHHKTDFNKVKAEIEKDSRYKLLDKQYKNERTKLNILDTQTNTKLSLTYRDWLDGTRINRKVFNSIEMANDINKFDNEYVSTDYSAKHAHDKLKIKHLTCGYEFEMQYNNFKNGQRCPLCSIKNASGNISKAVKKIIKYLEDNNVKFELEKKFDDLKYNRKLRYDFYIEDKNLLIEYQGIQHFTYYKSGYFNKEKYDEIVRNDELKKKYAIEHNFNIEYINYDDDIESKLNDILKKY